MPAAELQRSIDRDLVKAIARRSQQALAEVYAQHSPAVYGLARRITREPVLAEEVTQDVLLHLWNHPDKYDHSRGTLRSYLLARTHGRSIDLVRSEASRRRREEREGRLAPAAVAGVDDQAWRRLQGEEVRQALTSLPENEREAITLAFFGGLTYRQAATALGAPEGTVKSRIRSGLARLEKALSNRELQPA